MIRYPFDWIGRSLLVDTTRWLLLVICWLGKRVIDNAKLLLCSLESLISKGVCSCLVSRKLLLIKKLVELPAETEIPICWRIRWWAWTHGDKLKQIAVVMQR